MRLLPWEYGVRNLGRSPLRTAISVGAFLIVVVLLVAAGSFIRGLGESLGVSGEPRNVILLGAGSEESTERSEIPARTTGVVAASVSGIRSRLGVDYVSPEIHMALSVQETADATETLPANMRGITDAAHLVHPQVQITEGRAPRAGENELLVGGLAAARLGVEPERLNVGRTLYFDNREWSIVGRFIAPGTVMEAEIWIPLSDLLIIAKRDTISCVVVTVEDATFDDLNAFAMQRLDLELVAMRETDYYRSIERFYRPVRIMVLVTGGLIALAGLFGGLNTMYAAFAARVRELGTLQVLGYSRAGVVVSMVQESLIAAACGSLAGAMLGFVLLDGTAVRFSMGAFMLRVDAVVLLWSLLIAAVLGVVGVFPPAWRCLRLPITDALRSA